MLRRGVATALSCLVLNACSSDTAPAPEPELETPGSFVAVDEGDSSGALMLFRTLDALELPNETILFATVYNVDPKTWEEAASIAKGHDIPIRFEIELIARNPLVLAHPYRVVWFRTLTDEEKARIP